jgi:hypothetical protein
MKAILVFIVAFTCFCSACGSKNEIKVSQILGSWELKAMKGYQVTETNTLSSLTSFYCKDFDNCFMTIDADSVKCKGLYTQILTKDGEPPQTYPNLSFYSISKYALSDNKIALGSTASYTIDSISNTRMVLTWSYNLKVQGYLNEKKTTYFFDKR